MLYFSWRQKYPEKYRELLNDTHRNSVLIAPVLAFGMAFNVFLVIGYVYVDWMRINVQLLLPWASFVYALLWIWTIAMSIRLQAIALKKGFDVEKIEFLPSFFVVVPIVTLLTISMLRYGYYFQHKFHTPIPQAVFTFFACAGFGLMTWYMILGLFMLRDYFKKYLFTRQYFDESQWGLICPMVAYAVLSTFVYKHGMPYTLTMAATILFMILDIVILIYMISRQYMKIQRN